MQITSKPTIEIRKNYRLTSFELKAILGMDINEEVQSMYLYQGRSPNDIEKGKSADTELWEIHTIERRPMNNRDVQPKGKHH